MPWPAEPLDFFVARAPRRHLRALVSCEAVADELALVVDGGRRATPATADHLASCLRCQAELAAYRRLLRLLRSLRDEAVPAPSARAAQPAGLLHLGRPGTTGPGRRWAIAGGGLGMAVLGAAAVIVAVALTGRHAKAQVTGAAS